MILILIILLKTLKVDKSKKGKIGHLLRPQHSTTTRTQALETLHCLHHHPPEMEKILPKELGLLFYFIIIFLQIATQIWSAMLRIKNPWKISLVFSNLVFGFAKQL